MNTTFAFYVRRYLIAGGAYLILALLAVVGIVACGDDSAPQPSGTPPSTASLVRGQEIFAQYCTKCHPGGGAGAGPSLIGRNESASKITRTVRNGDGLMPSFQTSEISDEDLNQLVQYVQNLR
jgi:mono/diheme cytochrome c family protein